MHVVRPLGFAALALLVAVADIPEGVEPWQPWAFMVGVIAAVAVATRSVTRPGGTAATLAVLIALGLGAEAVEEPGQVPFGVFLVIAFLMADVAFHATLRESLVIAALGIGGVTAAEGLANDRGPADIAFVAMLWSSAAALALAVRWRRQVTDARDERIRMLERQRIARDLHDTVAHHVSAIALTAEGARGLLDTDAAMVDRSLGSIHTTATAALDDMRQMVSVLRDDEVSSPPLRLSDLPSSIATGDTVDLVWDVPHDLRDPSPTVVAATHRIIQESLTNTRRHAHGATTASVLITIDGDELVVCIVDDGRSSSAIATSGRRTGFGIVGMRERCAALGGSLLAGPSGGGWRVEARLPLGRSR
ncbi:MAG: sensor histidine kinase [Ilumatobacter sp.]